LLENRAKFILFLETLINSREHAVPTLKRAEHRPSQRTLRSFMDPDLHGSGSALIFVSWSRIRIQEGKNYQKSRRIKK
jgi:hypothetical protein